MEKVLYIAHTLADGSLPKAALEGLTAAKAICGELTIGLIGDDVQAAADSIAGSEASFLAVSGEAFGVSRYSTDTAAIEALVKQVNPEIVIAPSTARFVRSMPGATHRCGGKIDTHITGMFREGGKLEVQRWFYRQRMTASFSRPDRPWFLLVDGGIAPAFEGAGTATVTPVEVAVETPRTEVVGVQSPDSDAQTIRPEAEVLFVAGAGWTKKQADGEVKIKEAEGIILDFLEKAKASLGSTKSLVDQEAEGDVLSFMGHMNQIGQTGTTPRHSKGLATCCHGEEPHTVGWRFVNERRAISLDPNCGWAQGKADVLYIADAFEVMKKVNEQL